MRLANPATLYPTPTEGINRLPDRDTGQTEYVNFTYPTDKLIKVTDNHI